MYSRIIVVNFIYQLITHLIPTTIRYFAVYERESR
jgi:hypothetical protein